MMLCQSIVQLALFWDVSRVGRRVNSEPVEGLAKINMMNKISDLWGLLSRMQHRCHAECRV